MNQITTMAVSAQHLKSLPPLPAGVLALIDILAEMAAEQAIPDPATRDQLDKATRFESDSPAP